MAAVAMAEQQSLPARPACNAASRGRFWPVAANSDPKAMRQLSQCGSLEICSLGMWRYRWKPVAVNIRQMGKTPLEPTAECSALMTEMNQRDLAASR